VLDEYLDDQRLKGTRLFGQGRAFGHHLGRPPRSPATASIDSNFHDTTRGTSRGTRGPVWGHVEGAMGGQLARFAGPPRARGEAGSDAGLWGFWPVGRLIPAEGGSEDRGTGTLIRAGRQNVGLQRDPKLCRYDMLGRTPRSTGRLIRARMEAWKGGEARWVKFQTPRLSRPCRNWEPRRPGETWPAQATIDLHRRGSRGGSPTRVSRTPAPPASPRCGFGRDPQSEPGYDPTARPARTKQPARGLRPNTRPYDIKDGD